MEEEYLEQEGITTQGQHHAELGGGGSKKRRSGGKKCVNLIMNTSLLSLCSFLFAADLLKTPKGAAYFSHLTLLTHDQL